MLFKVGTKTKVVTAAAVVAVGFSSLVLMASPALATSVTCAQGTNVSGDICELAQLTGSGTFTPDKSMDNLQALVVGGGGTGVHGYGGGGGSVIVSNFSDNETDIAWSVGTGGTLGVVGTSSTLTQSGHDNVTATAGENSDGWDGGDSATYDGWVHSGSDLVGGGAGFGGNGAKYNGGSGVSPSSLTYNDAPFSGAHTTLGGGGATSTSTTQGTASGGGGSRGEFVSGEPIVVAALANSGGGGGGGGVNSTANGATGVVIFRWNQLATYTATFDLGNHGTAISSQSVVSGYTADEPTEPSATGWTFNGWYNDSEFDSESDFSDTFASDQTFFAKWTIVSLDVTFDNGDHGNAVESQVVDYSDSAVEPEAPSEAGFAFEGWYTDPTFELAANFSLPVTEDTVYYAKWSAVPVTVSFNLGEHGASVESQRLVYGDAATKPADPTAEGFVFGGWFTDAELKNPADFTTGVEADSTLYAAWSAVLLDVGKPSLPVTGAEISPVAVPLGILVLALGGGLIFWSTRRAALRRK